MASSLVGKKFIITGASAGIGLAIAKALSERGAHLLLVARRLERLESLELPHSIILSADVTSKNFLTELEAAGGMDAFGLINNAGLALGRSPVSQSDPAEWEKMWDVNVEAVFRITRALVEPMLARGGGDILNLCSIAGHWTYPGGAVYCATKHAVWAFTKALREETCGKNLRVMQVSPGMVESEFSLVRFGGDQKTAEAVYHGMTPLTPDDIARQVVFMLEQPRHVCIDEIISMPTDQGSPTTIVRHR
jgi:3-hydroxy acid dehydrogenase/malonic semialdehyde reductase